MSTVPLSEYKQQFEAVIKNPPPPGTILRPYEEGALALLKAEYIPGREPFIYGRAYVPSIVGQPVSSWVLRTKDAPVTRGYKIILLPKGRDAFLRRYPQMPDEVEVKSIKILSYSASKKSMLGVVHEWAD